VSDATVSTTSSRALLQACERLGLDVAALLHAAGLSRAQVDDPDARLPATAVARLWHAAMQHTGDDALPLRAAEAAPFGAYRVIDFLAASAPTVGDGLERVARYFALINSSVALQVRPAPDCHVVTLTSLDASVVLPRMYAEYALAVTVLHCRHAAGVQWPLVEVRFAFESPPSLALHERVFGCRVRFAHERSELVVDDAVWRTPTLGGSSEMLRVLEAHAERLMSSLQRETGTRAVVARLLAEELRGGEPSLPQLAKRMALSPRTLQRRLQA
jgi:hypothetical protein